MYLGLGSGTNATYSLSGTGLLSAATEYIGYNSTATASFQQTGGSNTTSTLSIGSGDQYVLSGGTLNVTGSIANNGTMDGGNGSATLSADCLVDLTSGTWKNYSGWTVSTGTNGLSVVPAGFNVSTGLAGVTTAGLGVHVQGTTLTVPAGMGFSGIGSISDPVVCQGTIATASSGGALNLTNGLSLSGNGSVNLSSGSLTVNDAGSGISGGTLTVTSQYVGNGGTGTFTHSAGTNTLSSLYLGYNSTDSGTYTLSGAGKLSVSSSQYIGYSGAGSFSQSGGTNVASNYLYMGYNSTAVGTYNLSGGSLSGYSEYVGAGGQATFTQSGGTNSATYSLWIGNNSTGSGTYNLTAGNLSASSVEVVGWLGTGSFNESGGTNTVPSQFYVGEYGTGTCIVKAARCSAAGNTEYLGYYGTGTVTQSGGANTASSLSLGYNSTGTGTYNLNGGTLAVNNLVRGSGTAAFNFGGGTLLVNSAFTTTMPIALTGIGGNANVNLTSYNAVSLAGVLSGPGGLNKLGGGTLTLAAANTFAGNTTIAGGAITLAAAAALQDSTLDYNGFGGAFELRLTHHRHLRRARGQPEPAIDQHTVRAAGAAGRRQRSIDRLQRRALRSRIAHEARLGHADPERRGYLHRADNRRGGRPRAGPAPERRIVARRGQCRRRSTRVRLHRSLSGFVYPVDPGGRLRRRLRRRLGRHLQLDRGRQRLGAGLGR